VTNLFEFCQNQVISYTKDMTEIFWHTFYLDTVLYLTKHDCKVFLGPDTT